VLPLLGAKRLDAITDEDIQRLKARMERKNAKTVNNALSVLSKMLKVAVEWKEIDRLPAAIRLLKPGTSEMAFYEEEDYERLVEAAAQVDERALIAVLIGGDAGLRTGEIIALEWTDIDFRRSLLHVNRAEWEGHIGTPKGGRARTVNMTSRLAAALKAHRHLKGPRVLYSDDKSTADRDALSSWIKRAERRAGLPITGRLHILRHTFCSRLAIRGATTKAIQELAGHASLTTTQRYMHLSPAAKESAIRLLEFGVRGEKRGEIGESGAASEENRR
jgi:integrase